ncbi:MAG TPA: divalent-cation tolerance protein CutA [Bryobacteraceae bacterium]|nr:divalent-cation tolerance protein CutA [Bryobacteraceae bacterium]
MTDKIVVLTTCDSEQEAEQVARRLIEKRLAACVNIVPGARSIYRWKEAIEEAGELVLLIKSRRDLFAALRAELSSVHSYELPEVIAMPIVDGSEEYLTWLDREVGAI